MQITSGTITISSSTPTTVQGSSAVDWSQVLAGNLLFVNGQVLGINTVNPSTKVLSLDAPYSGATITDAPYVIVRDFTPNFGIPVLNDGDLEAAAILTRAIRMIDARLGTTGSTTAEVLVSKNSHGFIVGNALRLNSSGVFERALADGLPPIGIVSAVVDANSFKLVTQGRVTGITGISLVAGKTYYLRASVDGSVNIVDDSSGAFTYVGSVRVPVLAADSSSSGWLLNLATSLSGTFSQNAPGLVPAPTTATGRVLKDTGWGDSTLSDRSIQSQHLNITGAVNWVSFAANGSNLSIANHVNDLNARLTTVETSGAARSSMVYAFYKPSGGSPNLSSFTVPEGVNELELTVYSGAQYNDYLPFGVGNYHRFPYVPVLGSASYSYQNAIYRLSVEDADVIDINFGDALPEPQFTTTSEIRNVRVSLNGDAVINIRTHPCTGLDSAVTCATPIPGLSAQDHVTMYTKFGYSVSGVSAAPGFYLRNGIYVIAGFVCIRYVG